MDNIGPGENHGCPFRHHESKTVRQRVESYGIKKDEVDAIMKKLEEGHFQIACGMHFSAVHLKDLSTGSVSHPNQWYLESRGDVTNTAQSRGNKNIKTTKASIYSQSSQSSQSTQESSQVDDVMSQFEADNDDALLNMLESSENM